MASSGVGRFRRLVPVGGYVLAQPFFLFTVLQAFLERGVSIWWPFPDFVMFLYVFVPASLPALLVGAVVGVVRSLGRSRWIAPLRIVTFLLITILAFDDSNLTGSTSGLALGTYYCTLVGMEAILAVLWGIALLTRRFLEGRRTRVESR